MTFLAPPIGRPSDRALMHVLLVWSSSETARQAAAAWLAAFDAARAAGAGEGAAHTRANAALEQAMRRESGAYREGSGMLAATRGCASGAGSRARSPPTTCGESNNARGDAARVAARAQPGAASGSPGAISL